MDQTLEEFLLSDRQWLRQQRIDHAKAMFKQTPLADAAERGFWLSVIEANSIAHKTGHAKGEKNDPAIGAAPIT